MAIFPRHSRSAPFLLEATHLNRDWLHSFPVAPPGVLYELLAKVCDRCRDAGNVVFAIILKNN